MNTRRNSLPSLRTAAASRAQFSPIRGSVAPRISVAPAEAPAANGLGLPAREAAAADLRRSKPVQAAVGSRFAAAPVKVTIAEFPAAPTADFRGTVEIGRLWTPGLLDRLQSQLTRYRE